MTTAVISIDDLCDQLRDLQAKKRADDEEPVVVIGDLVGEYELLAADESEHDMLQVGDGGFSPDTFADSAGTAALQNADASMLHTLVVAESDLSEGARAMLHGEETDDGDDDDDGQMRLVTDGGVQFADLHAFERDLLYAVRALERDGDAPKGLAVKELLETEYDEELNHSRLYQNLDGLVECDLLEKGKKDNRTNEYGTTDEGRDLLEACTERRMNAVDLDVDDDPSEIVTDDGLPNHEDVGSAQCQMPECDRMDDVKTCKDPSANLLYVCGDCRSEVAVLEVVSDETVPGVKADVLLEDEA
ncbi:helix-turn-helix transcriptional regulator [Halorussus salinus]|uniref:helix-turn-helix transcriptional regulator n=1 Tax=Halorussus salinus TaxID=1364935 RepID=UPI0010921D7E